MTDQIPDSAYELLIAPMRLAPAEKTGHPFDVLDPLEERVHAGRDQTGKRRGTNGLGLTGLGTSAARVAGRNRAGSGASAGLDVLWTRHRAAGSRLADHVAAVRRGAARDGGWVCDPEATLAAMSHAPAAWGERFAPWMRDCAEMVKHGRALLAEIRTIRRGGAGPAGQGQVALVPVTVGADPVGALVARARLGENAGRSTKSKLSRCSSADWAAVAAEFGLQGVAEYPNFALGSWWMGLLSDDYDDWRQDYVAILDYSFYLEYNVDTAYGDGDDRLKREILALWNMPDLPADLQARRAHVAANLAYFDTKRRDEADTSDLPTTGLTAWVYHDRDHWRDLKAVDSGIFGHYLGFVPGPAGRDDMMLTGLTNDWVDIGPDLRHQECGQSVLALTRGSLVMADLLDCYERTVWMINTQWTEEGGIRPERYAACMETLGTCLWETGNHRQDMWRYYALGYDLCRAAFERDLYLSGQLADCYGEDLTPITPPSPLRVRVPRRSLPFRVDVGGVRHSGRVDLHTAVCDAVGSGVLPMGVVEQQFIIPWLLRERRITAEAFLTHMDRTYCRHFAQIMRSGHANDFGREYGEAIAALAMEQWWHGMYFAIGAGSLIEAQPGHIAGDRSHAGEQGPRGFERMAG
ncbi:hypothetical protein [Kitasatospora sp. NPDC093558]|uniref:hypothetical protein n=1 Tax=Kitasatospora sp. NPDC093558 TaxID=3155201 RepID=UPI00341A0B74